MERLLRRRLRASVAIVLSLALSMLGLTAASALGAQSPRQANSSALAVGSLTTDDIANPLGISDSQPQLAWVINSAARGVAQASYQIRVATSEQALVAGQNLTWDSGVVKSAQSFNIAYGGPALSSGTRYYWQVRVWDNHGGASGWSAPSWFETAFLNPGQFQGDWIGDPDPLSLTGSNWIWYPEGNPTIGAPSGQRFFRRIFDLPRRAYQIAT